MSKKQRNDLRIRTNLP